MIGFGYNEKKGKEIVKELKGKKACFILTLGNTETAKIPGISAAGAFPEITDYTPPADAELLFYGGCRCIDGIPVTPDGIPTPAIITMSSLQLTGVPCFVVEGGLRVKPFLPYFTLGGFPGEDIRKGSAVKNAEEVFKRAKILGRELSKGFDYAVIGESIAGGTTTALAVLNALGIDAKVSSSLPANPVELKKKVVEEAMKNAGIKFGELKDNPISAIECLGDPMLPAFAGIALGFAEEKKALLAGGTQAGAVLAVCTAINQELAEEMIIVTTKWIMEDRSSDLNDIAKQASKNSAVIYSKLSFSSTKMEGLKAYEKGVVKEGVGAGGSAVLASLYGVKEKLLLETIESNLQMLMEKGKK